MTNGYVLLSVGLLTGSCMVMTAAWYLHLKFKHWSMKQAIMYSWLIAGAEYCLMIPANRVGVQYAELSPAVLRGIAELAIIISFLLFNRFVLEHPVLWNHVIGFAVVFFGVGVVLAEPPYSGPLGRLVECIFNDDSRAGTSLPGTCAAEPLPDSLALVRRAFPLGKWSAVYLTKQYDGMNPALGGYPTPLDVGYPFEYPAPFFGQPGAGTPFHCPFDAPPDVDIEGSCPKVVTSADDDIEGPGHIRSEAATQALVHAHQTCDPDLPRWFASSCRTAPADLLLAIRKVYPRSRHPTYAEYPDPGLPGAYTMRSLDFPSPQGPPHFCDPDYRATKMWVDYCPCTQTLAAIHTRSPIRERACHLTAHALTRPGVHVRGCRQPQRDLCARPSRLRGMAAVACAQAQPSALWCRMGCDALPARARHLDCLPQDGRGQRPRRRLPQTGRTLRVARSRRAQAKGRLASLRHKARDAGGAGRGAGGGHI